MSNKFPEVLQFPYDDIDPTPQEHESLRAWTVRIVSRIEAGKSIVIGRGNFTVIRNYITHVSDMTGREFQTVKADGGLRIIRHA